MSTVTESISAADPLGEWVEVVRKQVDTLRFGTVQITVHGSRVVQIETTEKIRFGQSSSANNPSSHLQAKT